MEDLADVPDGISPSSISQQNSSSRRKSARYKFEFFPWPDLHQYAELVGVYNSRLLTYQSDALLAFSAVVDTLSRSFQGGFLYGIPELYFDISMLWRPNMPTRLRAGSDGSPEFPSWSWVGWQGNVVFSCLKITHQLLWDGKTFATPIRIHPLVVWYKIDRETGRRCRIDNSYHHFQSLRHNASISPPSGWSRVKPSVSACPKDFYIFRYETIPSKDFIHPIPIPQKPLDSSPNNIWDKFLHLRTWRCSLFSGPVLLRAGGVPPQQTAWSNLSNAFVPKCLSFCLMDHSGRWAGMIYSNFSCPEESPEGVECEIILISGSSAVVDSAVVDDDDDDDDERDNDNLKRNNDVAKIYLEEWMCIDEIKDTCEYEFFNVLWIERGKGDVAYRKALGRVWKTAWQRQVIEEVDIMLG
jgi:hypothetical protein